MCFCDSCCAALNKLIAQQQQQIYLGSIIQRGVSKVCIGKDKRWSDWLLDFALGNPKFWQRGNVTTNHNWFQAQVTKGKNTSPTIMICPVKHKIDFPVKIWSVMANLISCWYNSSNSRHLLIVTLVVTFF